jgi:hypothetical protein
MTLFIDDTGRHVSIAVYNTVAKTTAEAAVMLPVGARFVLKNPFLKCGNNQWRTLRVDQPDDLVLLDLPVGGARNDTTGISTRVLVVGDGDFSFSAAVARLSKSAHITATSLDSREKVCAKYLKAEANLDELQASAHVTLLHGVDATQLVEKLTFETNNRGFDCVMWNFPYPIGKGSIFGDPCTELMRGFFRSVSSVLADGGQVRMTLARGQGGTTKELHPENHISWRIEDVAAEEGFDLEEVLPFDASEYVGYEPRRVGPQNTSCYSMRFHPTQLYRFIE